MIMPLASAVCAPAVPERDEMRPGGPNITARLTAPSDQAPELGMLLLLLTAAEDAADEPWRSDDEANFWLWLVRCSDGELESFIRGGLAHGPYLEHALAERQFRQREQHEALCRCNPFLRAAFWGANLARWFQNLRRHGAGLAP
jgi:hypothetical protein